MKSSLLVLPAVLPKKPNKNYNFDRHLESAIWNSIHMTSNLFTDLKNFRNDFDKKKKQLFPWNYIRHIGFAILDLPS